MIVAKLAGEVSSGTVVDGMISRQVMAVGRSSGRKANRKGNPEWRKQISGGHRVTFVLDSGCQ